MSSEVCSSGVATPMNNIGFSNVRTTVSGDASMAAPPNRTRNIARTTICVTPDSGPIIASSRRATPSAASGYRLSKTKASTSAGPLGPTKNAAVGTPRTRQQAFFRRLLTDWKRAIVTESETTLANLQDGPLREPDLTDRASSETDWAIELRTRDRQRKLISKIDAALRRLDEGEYGYCEVTGEPISLGRLIARPIATMTLEAQERHERNERVSRDD